MRVPIAWLAVLACTSSACRNKASEAEFDEQAFVEKEVVKLEAALAERSEARVSTGCISTTLGLDHMPAPLVDKITRLCFVEAPRMFLQIAVADVTARNAAHPDLADLNCMQLFVGDALDTLAEHPTTDPEIVKLVETYTRLCPEQAAKHHAK